MNYYQFNKDHRHLLAMRLATPPNHTKEKHMAKHMAKRGRKKKITVTRKTL